MDEAFLFVHCLRPHDCVVACHGQHHERSTDIRLADRVWHMDETCPITIKSMQPFLFYYHDN